MKKKYSYQKYNQRKVISIIITGFVLLFVPSFTGWATIPLQEIIDDAKEGDIIKLSPGIYKGPAVVNKKITIDGRGKAVVDGGGEGSVIWVKADGAILTGLIIQNSGERHDTIDTGIAVRSSNNRITHNIIRNCLFGIDLHMANKNIIEGNDISSKPFELGLRGDAIRLWWSNNNILRKNYIHDSRDFVIWYSRDNIIEKNIGVNSRYSMHFMYSHKNIVRDNYFSSNSVGIYVMYTHGVELIGNTVKYSLGSTGMGIGLKDASNVILKNNRIINCARGMGIDKSPFEPGTENVFIDNDFFYNSIAIFFNTDRTRVNNNFSGNVFFGNIEDVAVTGTRGVPKGFWNGNYWDKYGGFDSDRDGYGDSPYNMYHYADRLWNDHPELQFFIASPVMSFLNFLQRLAPFSEPDLILVDSPPLMRMPERHYEHFIMKLEAKAEVKR